jgi:heterodisulfide reductase subunit A
VAEPGAIPRLQVELAGRPVIRRAVQRRLDHIERRTSYDEVLAPLEPDEAVAEAKRCMSCGGCSECMQCVVACLPKCIDHTQQDEVQMLEVGAVVLSPGAVPANAALRPEFGYGRYPNVVSSMEFERMLSASGPFGGELLRPSDGGHPLRIAFIQCVGSRDSSGRQATEAERRSAAAHPGGGFFARGETLCGTEYCSSVCCMYTAKEAVIAQEHVPGLRGTVFYMDLRTYGKEFERYVERAQQENGVRYVRAMVSSVKENPGNRNLRIRYHPPAGHVQEEEFDLVVLAVGLRPPTAAMEAARRIGVDLNEYGFVRTSEFDPPATSRPGVFVCGTFREPKDIPETVTDGSAAAAAASRLLAAARGTLTLKREFPPERDVSRELPRVGVIVCKCGRNIASVIDTDSVAAWASGLPGVVWAESLLYTCAQDSIEKIKAAVVEHGLNRVVVASCTPRTHEALFRETIREAGLNPALFEMANIREQSSWVHRDEPVAATAKARDLVAAAVAKARLLRPVQASYSDLNHSALVAGGGAAGLTAALAIAEQGFDVCLVEREAELGGNLRRVHFTLEGGDPQKFLDGLIERVTSHPRIRVLTGATVKSSSGYVGNYRTVISRSGPDGLVDQELEHGVVVVATGALQGLPSKGYLYGEHPGVITQMELDETLARADAAGGKGFAPRTVAMIQCAGSREPERPYCSRVCCTEAIRNALRIKRLSPASQVYILYRDMRTYGFKERFYREAREAGVIFVRYETDAKPQVAAAPDGALVLQAPDPVLDGAMLTIRPDLLVLAAPVVPDVDTALSQAYKLPLTADGFYLEAHMKLRPVDFASDGVFLCGLAHGPKLLAESLAQAEAASVRATAVLAAEKLESRGNVARVNDRLCRGCGICVDVCAYDARVLDPETGVAKVLQVLCQGCGACVAACPSGACEQDGFTKKQIAAMLEAVLGYEVAEASAPAPAPRGAAGPVSQKEVAGP